MASDLDFVLLVVDKIKNAGDITYRKMFGEYGIYSNGKMFGLICDNQFFIKPTDGGRKYIGDVTEASPYPNAKPHFLIDELDDEEWLCELIKITVAELPEPKKKKKASKK